MDAHRAVKMLRNPAIRELPRSEIAQIIEALLEEREHVQALIRKTKVEVGHLRNYAEAQKATAIIDLGKLEF